MQIKSIGMRKLAEGRSTHQPTCGFVRRRKEGAPPLSAPLAAQALTKRR
jgi:hypothetical protein